MPSVPTLTKRALDSTILALSDVAPLISSSIETLMTRQDAEKLAHGSSSAVYRIEFPTPKAAAVLTALQDYANEFEDPKAVLLNDASLEQLIHEWSMVVNGLKEMRAPSGTD